MDRRLSPCLLAATLAACGHPAPASPAPDSGLTTVQDDLVDEPLAAATPDQVTAFHTGDALFDQVYLPADGLGPLYIRNSCGSCHASGGKGPGLVQKMTWVAEDGFTPLADQSAFAFGHTLRPYRAGGAQTSIGLPDAGPPDGGELKLTSRVGPPLYGRGYLEAIDEAEILRVQAEQEQRGDGIHGQVNRVTFHSQANPDSTFEHHTFGEAGVVGRFGLKARNATLDDFTADAFQGDMGMTSPMRPTEPPNPDGLTDDGKPGVDLAIDTVNRVATYLRLIEIPRRPAASAQGRALFDQAKCSACHVPSLHTRADYPIAALANIDAPVFTDLLLHDLGDDLADGMTDESSTGRQWRTAPLIGLRFLPSYLHDGRAHSLDEAIRLHQGPGSEANGAIAAYAALSDADRSALLDYVKGL